ncbi:hypothetical protein SAMN05216328_101631 [Ensifer sp. YR511]|jgi:hypothetical protein|nr:hypothetical protein SAMN05216328_101631 [Ensifer sp. YR511]
MLPAVRKERGDEELRGNPVNADQALSARYFKELQSSPHIRLTLRDPRRPALKIAGTLTIFGMHQVPAPFATR